MTNYDELYEKVKKNIKEIPAGQKFYLRDCIDNPPSKIGVYLIRDCKELHIDVVEKDEQGTNVFIKLL